MTLTEPHKYLITFLTVMFYLELISMKEYLNVYKKCQRGNLYPIVSVPDD